MPTKIISLLTICLLALPGCGPSRQTLSIPTQPQRLGIVDGVARGHLESDNYFAYEIDRASGAIRIDAVVPRFGLDFFLTSRQSIKKREDAVRLQVGRSTRLNSDSRYLIVVNNSSSSIDYEFSFAYEAPWVQMRRELFDPAQTTAQNETAPVSELELAIRNLEDFQRLTQRYTGVRDLHIAADSLIVTLQEMLTDRYFSQASRFLNERQYNEAEQALAHAKRYVAIAGQSASLYPQEAVDRLEARIMLQQGIQLREQAEAGPWNEKHSLYAMAAEKYRLCQDIARRIGDALLLDTAIAEAALSQISKAQALLNQAESLLVQSPIEALAYCQEAKTITEAIKQQTDVARKMGTNLRQIETGCNRLERAAKALADADNYTIQVSTSLYQAEGFALNRQYTQAISSAREAAGPLAAAERSLSEYKAIIGIDARVKEMQSQLSKIYENINAWQKMTDIRDQVGRHDRLLTMAAGLNKSSELGDINTALRHYETIITQISGLPETGDPELDEILQAQLAQSYQARSQTMYRKAEMLFYLATDAKRPRSERQALLQQFRTSIDPKYLKKDMLPETDQVQLEEYKTKAYIEWNQNLFEDVKSLVAQNDLVGAGSLAKEIEDQRLQKQARLAIAEGEVRQILQVAGDLSGRGENRKAIRALQKAEEMAKSYELQRLSNDIAQQIDILEQTLPTVTRQNPLSDRPQPFKQEAVPPGKSVNVLIPVQGGSDIQIYIPQRAGNIRLTALGSEGESVTVRGPLPPITVKGVQYVTWVVWARNEKSMVEIPFENGAPGAFDMASCLYVEVEPSY